MTEVVSHLSVPLEPKLLASEYVDGQTKKNTQLSLDIINVVEICMSKKKT